MPYKNLKCKALLFDSATQPAAVADAAARPQDRGVFERQMHTNVIPIYWCGAAKRQPVSWQLITVLLTNEACPQLYCYDTIHILNVHTKLETHEAPFCINHS